VLSDNYNQFYSANHPKRRLTLQDLSRLDSKPAALFDFFLFCPEQEKFGN